MTSTEDMGPLVADPIIPDPPRIRPDDTTGEVLDAIVQVRLGLEASVSLENPVAVLRLHLSTRLPLLRVAQSVGVQLVADAGAVSRRPRRMQPRLGLDHVVHLRPRRGA